MHAAVLQHHVDTALGRPQGDGLVRALALLRERERPDLRLPLRIEHACTRPVPEALGELGDVIRAATAIQHRGTALAAHVRAAGLAAEVYATRARGCAQRALDLTVRLGSTMLQPGELWPSCARA